MPENGSRKSGKYTCQQFIEAIPGTGGIVSEIAAKVGCAWNTAKRYIDRHPTVRRAYDNERNQITDKAKGNIIKAIEGKDLQISKWWLQVMDPEFKESYSVDVTSQGQSLAASLEQALRRVYGAEPDGDSSDGNDQPAAQLQGD